MITRDLKEYEYFQYEGKDTYGFPKLSEEPKGKVKLAIYITNQSIQDNINYSGASYVGFTNSLLDDSYVIKYGELQLKVLYVNPQGRMKQVFLSKV